MTTPFERNEAVTATYSECISFYQALAQAHPDKVRMSVAGTTDIGEPLHTVVLSGDGQFEPQAIRATGRRILMINNGIHPGEPEGIDATMMLARDLVNATDNKELWQHLAIVIIPVYNIDGCLNRGSYSRANQNGPAAYGFRGNARNYDLNRDFIKCDTKNAQSFNQIFTHWRPDVLVDNHTSNGADYQYVMTLIATQHDKLPSPLGKYLQERMLPVLYKEMAAKHFEMTPYVNTEEETPDQGIYGFLDHPRYSSGYAALFHCLSFMPETHMLKPYPARVHSTYAFMEVMIGLIKSDHQALADAVAEAQHETATRDSFPLQWALDNRRVDSLAFKGFEAAYKTSEVSGLDRLWYDRTKPYTKTIPYFNTYRPVMRVEKPAAYIIPQAYQAVIDRLQWNGVAMEVLEKDTIFEVEQYLITHYASMDKPYEGHYMHNKVEIDKRAQTVQYRKGDIVVRTGTPMDRYLVETLEPQAPDAFFAWNFFDAILQQKEYFSAYVFEDLAAQFLTENPAVRLLLEERKKRDPEFAKSAHAQLEFVYHHSPWYEPTHNVYPIARLH